MMKNTTGAHLNYNDDFFNNKSRFYHVSCAGFEFNSTDNKWTLDSEVNVNISVVDHYNEEYRYGLRQTLVHYSIVYSSKYVQQVLVELRRFIKINNEFNLNALSEYKYSCPSSTRHQCLSLLRCFLRKMLYLEFKVPNEFMSEFNSWVLGGGERGVAVLTEDPELGPFSELEFRAIKAGLNSKYAGGFISARQYSLAQLFAVTFRRPTNLKQIKIKDLKNVSSILKTNQQVYEILIPRSKGKGRVFRSQFTPFAIISDIGKVLEEHIKCAVSTLESSLDKSLSDTEIAELPLFFNHRLSKDFVKLQEDQRLDYLKSEIPHLSSQEISAEMVSIINMLEIVSERTGLPLNVTSYRFRYTGGTRAAQSGAGVVTIAQLLDHLDTQHTSVYVANTPEIGFKISQIMNNPLARYATAFLGKVVQNEEEAFSENPGATRIPCREKECDVGSCGSNSFCTDYAPVACYLCIKFRPWKNAPHHLVLEWLLEERNRLQQTDCNPKVVSINDSAILAVAQVISACKEAKA